MFTLAKTQLYPTSNVHSGSSNNVTIKDLSTLGPLGTQTNSHDHEIVRAQKKCTKPVSWHFQNHILWTRTLKCGVKSYVTGPSTECYSFQHMIKYNKSSFVRFHNAMISPGVALGYLQEVVPGNKLSDHNPNPFNAIRIDFTCILPSQIYSVGPSSIVWSGELGPALPYPPMRLLEVIW